MLNKIMLIGHVGKKRPEIRRTQDGRPIATFSIATSKSWRDKASGERKQRTQWHRVVCFSEPLCKIIEQYVDKGSKLYIEGTYVSRLWTDKKDVEREAFEVVLEAFNSTLTMLDRIGQERAPAADENSYAGEPKETPPAQSAGEQLNDEIPF